MSLAQGNNTPTRSRIQPGSPDLASDALTTRPVRREEEEKEGQLKETCQCHNLIPENKDISYQNGQRR